MTAAVCPSEQPVPHPVSRSPPEGNVSNPSSSTVILSAWVEPSARVDHHRQSIASTTFPKTARPNAIQNAPDRKRSAQISFRRHASVRNIPHPKRTRAAGRNLMTRNLPKRSDRITPPVTPIVMPADTTLGEINLCVKGSKRAGT